jgi:hypothetical protein
MPGRERRKAALSNWFEVPRPAPQEQPLRADHRLGDEVVVAVERDRQPAFLLDVDLEMILQVRPHARTVGDHGDGVLGEMRAGADAREHQELRRVDRGGREDDLAPGRDGLRGLAAADHDARGAALADHHPLGEAAQDLHPARPQRRPQVGVGRGPAPPAPDRRLHRAEALLFLAVVILGRLETRLPAGLDEGVVERVGARAARHVQRAVGAAPRALAAVPAFHALEVGQDVGIGPAGRAHLGPGVEIAGMAAHVDHAVDRGRAAEHLAARHHEAPVAEMRLGLGEVAPVVAGHVHRKAERRWHLDEGARVRAAEFEHQNRVAGLAEPVGKRRTGRACADDDEIGLHQRQRRPRASARGRILISLFLKFFHSSVRF